MTFYDDWLAVGERNQDMLRRSPQVARDAEIPWVSTRQDARVKLMVDDSLGFPTMGGSVLKAEIPVGWHTGSHRHGEESIHILKGSGFSVVNGQRFDWTTGSTLQIPYRAAHQHFNTGDEAVQYLSAMPFNLEAFVKIGSIEQLEECGPNDGSEQERYRPSGANYLENGPRVLLRIEDAPEDPGEEPSAKLMANLNQHYRTKYLILGRNNFKATSVAMTHMFEEPPGYHGGRHKHLEAVIYILGGEGYSEVNGVVQRWGEGDVLHVPPAMYEHEHYNDTKTTQFMLRIQFGIRKWFQDIWPDGYMPQRVYDENGQPIAAGRIERERVRERVS